ncbi:MAG: hypothetical protein K9J13_10655 [Saprospiraceae bacterium]|nr:hypothetical protein [Saprospiraceae bacterium]
MYSFCNICSFYESRFFCERQKIKKKLDKIVLRSLGDFNPNAIDAFKDLENFVNNIIDKNKDEITSDTIEYSAGAWIIWNLTKKNPIEGESKIAGVLGKMFFTGFVNYYEPKVY